MVNDIGQLSDLNFSLTLDATQAIGEYKFTGRGGSGFTNGITVYDTAGVYYGNLAIDRKVVFGDRIVTLKSVGSGLNISVVENPYSAFELPADLVAMDGNVCSWGHIAKTAGYVVQFSRDNFQSFVTVELSDEAITLNNLPFSLRWRVRAADATVWTYGEEIAANTQTTGMMVTGMKDWQYDMLFASPDEKWDYTYAAQHLGEFEGWNGTRERVQLNGKNKLDNIFEASSDANILLLTDDAGGDALFIDDVYSVFPDGVAAQARVAKIDEIRAGDGDDIVDLTSQRFEYVGGGMTVKGGLGDDVIWANKGDNTLFGDAGNDRIVGAGGNDVIVGGSGDDSMHGGGGDDIFAFGGDWGNDIVEQLADGKVTLWFDNGSLDKWNEATLTYKDGDKSVVVNGVSAENISLKFGDDGSSQYDTLLVAGAFDEFSGELIFENKKTRGMLA
jgi:Ca2+-binding RTX toxin-like protein